MLTILDNIFPIDKIIGKIPKTKLKIINKEIATLLNL